MQFRKKTKQLFAEINSQSIDPRFLLEGSILLWENPNSDKGMSQPLLQGSIDIPVRLLSVIYDYQQPIVKDGEEVVRLNLSMWEVDPSTYPVGKKPPYYRGKVQTRASVIAGDVGTRLKELFKKALKNNYFNWGDTHE